MKRRDLSVTIALCVSLIVHASILLALAAVDVHELNRSLHHPAPSLQALLAGAPLPSNLPPAVAPPPPPPAAPVPDPSSYEELFGERGAKGKAANSSPGDEPMEAQQGSQEQAALTPRPGLPNSASGGSDSSAAQRNSAAAAATPPSTPFGLPMDLSAPFGVPLTPPPASVPPKPFKPSRQANIAIPTPGPEPSPLKSPIARADSSTTRPVDQPPTTQPLVSTAPQPPHPPQDRSVADATTRPSLAQNQPATRPVIALASAGDLPHFSESARPAPAPAAPAFHGPSGEPGTRSESESDPFTSRPTFTWHNGKVEARDGRKVKTVRPKLTNAGEIAVATLDAPMVSFVVSIDDAGKVTGVDYLHHSGSNEIDLPAYRAMFEWEFEPTHDKHGRAVPDAIIVTLRWQ